ncbi:hypothetical protein AJ80_08313 [Polytolypa hystricis UAMH7299]|uniref:RNA polymerase I-specific transcription initiation factor RRN6-like protein n=1 Tax=Polytolypa hystricis (strain UAMH7299) TaxID=1447883 RepID=A0A2B7XA30_POLH7|nr:hypothetical protein AJ80_08313 [Polytolypa hystricis UAMH7299]
MGEQRRNILQFGHLGTASYLPDLQTWEFSRKFLREPVLSFLGPTRIHTIASNTDGLPSRALLRTKREDALLKAHPELASGSVTFSLHETASRAVTSTLSKFDPLISTCLAVGNAIEFSNNRFGDQTVPIIVRASAGRPATLQLVELENEPFAWSSHHTTVSWMPSTGHKGSAVWVSLDGPVQQICFAETVGEKPTWMAARSPLSVTIYRPLYRTTRPVTHYSNDGFDRTSLDANPLVSIPISLTGGQPHANASFNPWFQQQIGLVDCQGNWSIWDINRKHQNSIWNADREVFASLIRPADQDVKPNENEHYDGWASITWVASVHKLIVCDRRNMALCRVDSGSVQQCQIDLGLERPSEWIIDIKRSQANPCHVFVLTTSRIVWLAILPDEPSSSQNGHGSEISILLAWRHFRDTEDTSQQIAQVHLGNETLLILYSRLNSLAQVFRFGYAPEDPSIPMSLADPLPLNLLSISDESKEASEPQDRPCFSTVIFQPVAGSSIVDSNDDAKTLKLIKFIGQSTDSQVTESLYIARMNGEQDSEDYADADLVPPQRPLARSAKWVEGDDFIVDDLDEYTVPEPTTGAWMNSVQAFSNRSTQVRFMESWSPIYLTACSAVYDVLNTKGNLSTHTNKVQALDDWIEVVSNKARNMELTESPTHNCRTMFEISEVVPFLDDIENNSRSFDQFLSNIADPAQSFLPDFECSTLPLPYSASSDFSLASGPEAATPVDFMILLYDSLIRDWLSPLPSNIPNQLRMSKEKLLRVIVSDLTLSRVCFVPRQLPDDEEEFHGSYDAENASAPDSMLGPNSQPSMQQSEPYASSQMGDLDTQTQTPKPTKRTCPTLRKYTTINEQLPATRRVTNNILSHWALGSDPSTYDWETTTRAVQDEESQSDVDQTSKERRRKRREERRRRRLTEQAQSQASVSSVPVIQMWGSQPQQQGFQHHHQSLDTTSPAPNILKSSQVTEEDLPMTQIERGLFGGRDAGRRKSIKDRKKKRAAGF